MGIPASYQSPAYTRARRSSWPYMHTPCKSLSGEYVWGTIEGPIGVGPCRPTDRCVYNSDRLHTLIAFFFNVCVFAHLSPAPMSPRPFVRSSSSVHPIPHLRRGLRVRRAGDTAVWIRPLLSCISVFDICHSGSAVVSFSSYSTSHSVLQRIHPSPTLILCRRHISQVAADRHA